MQKPQEGSDLFHVDQEEVLEEWQDFRVAVQGDAFELYWNGDLISTVTDNTLSWGRVGLFSWINAGGSIDTYWGGILFDDFVVTPVTVTGVEDWSIH